MVRLARPSRRRRAFALPLVVILSMVATMVIAVMLERQSQQTLVTIRQLRWTQDRHLESGVREVVGAWVKGATRRLGEISRSGGHALDLTMDDGRRFRLDIEDAQGSVLTAFEGVPAGDLAAAQALYEEAVRRAGDPRTLEEWTRPVGPVAVSAASAPEAVLALVGSTKLGEGQAAAMARDIVLARDSGDPTGGQQWLRRILADYVSDLEDRREMQRLIVGEASLWRIRVSVFDGRDRLMSMYEAVVHVDGRELQQRADSGDFTPLGPFLMWRRVEDMDPGVRTGPGR